MPVLRKDGRQILFVHVPKTGGTAIERAFKAHDWAVSYLDGKMGRGTLNHVRRSTPQHMEADLLRMLFRLDRFDLTFLIVRDPVGRLRSEYLWRTRRRADVGLDGASVEAWAEEVFEGCRQDPHLHDNHIRPQADFLLPDCRVFRFEDGLDRIVQTLEDDYGLGLTGEVPRARTGSGTTGHHSRDVEITPSLQSRIREFYARDYELFGYA